MDQIKVKDKDSGMEVVIPAYLYDPDKHIPVAADVDESPASEPEAKEKPEADHAMSKKKK
jgi:hypothetical protein